jgi:hypothetical protein
LDGGLDWLFGVAVHRLLLRGDLGFSQWQVGEAVWGFWVALAALLSLAAIYLVAHFGQQWSVDQMQQLRDELEAILRQAGVSGLDALAGQG